MSNLTSRESQITAWLADQRSAMVDLLAEVVNTDSGTYDKAGVDAVGLHFANFFERLNIAVKRTSNDKFGDFVRASPASNFSAPSILLLGHLDTVFKRGEAKIRPFTIRGARAYGPGVADMKAGLVMNAFVLAAFKEINCLSRPLVALFTGDEEVGSPTSRHTIEDEARRASFVLNAEPGRVSGNVVTERKGGVFMKFEVQGRAAHSGANLRDGISAIEELAYKVLGLHALTDFEKGTTVNVGLVSGGQSVNTTAPNAEGQIDLRFRTAKDRDEAMTAIREIVASNRLPGASASLEVIGEFFPLMPNQASMELFHCYKTAAADVGLELQAEQTGGCADSGISASLGIPTLCGLGPVGGKLHTPDEYVELETIVPRAQAAALTILRLDEKLS